MIAKTAKRSVSLWASVSTTLEWVFLATQDFTPVGPCVTLVRFSPQWVHTYIMSFQTKQASVLCMLNATLQGDLIPKEDQQKVNGWVWELLDGQVMEV